MNDELVTKSCLDSYLLCFPNNHIKVAATGAVVMAVEHTDGTATSTRLSDGSVIPFSPGRLGTEGLARRAAELRFGLDFCTALPAELSVLVDETRLFLGGHSYGGPSCLLALDGLLATPGAANVAGLLLHDPAVRSQIRTPVRTLSYVSDQYAARGVRCGQTTLQCIGAAHGNFVDAALWAPLPLMRALSRLVIPVAGEIDPLRLYAALACSAAAFMAGDDAAAARDGGCAELMQPLLD